MLANNTIYTCLMVPELADITVALVDCQLAGTDRIKSGRVASISEVRTVVTGALSTGLCN